MLAKEQEKTVKVKERPKIVLTPLEQFLYSSDLVNKLENAKTPEKMQIILENALL